MRAHNLQTKLLNYNYENEMRNCDDTCSDCAANKVQLVTGRWNAKNHPD